MNVRHLTPRPPEDRGKLMAEHMKTMQSMAGDMGARHQMMEKRMEMMQTMMKMMIAAKGLRSLVWLAISWSACHWIWRSGSLHHV